MAQKGGKMMLFVGPRTGGEYPHRHTAHTASSGKYRVQQHHMEDGPSCRVLLDILITHDIRFITDRKFSTEQIWQKMIGLVLMFINGMELNFSLTKVLHNSVTAVLCAPLLPPPVAPHSPHKMMSIESPFSV